MPDAPAVEVAVAHPSALASTVIGAAMDRLAPTTVSDSGGNALCVGVPAMVSGKVMPDKVTLDCDAGDWF